MVWHLGFKPSFTSKRSVPFCLIVNQVFLSEMICKKRATPGATSGSFMLRGRDERAASGLTGQASRVYRELIACS
jgi:hypothetical protein